MITSQEMVLVDLGTRVDRLVLKAQQTAAIMEKSLHILQAVELFGLLVVALIRPLGQLHFQRLQTLFQLHDPLGEGMGGLGQILGVASDPKGNGFRCHDRWDMMPMTTQIPTPAKRSAALTSP